MAELPDLIVVIGVSGAGKTTLAIELAHRLQRPMLDADDLHPPENRRKLNAGIPLTDTDRAPWMRAVCARLAAAADAGEPLVLAHSGLRRHHRAALRMQGQSSAFVLLEGSFELLTARLEARQGHFMAASLLRSQFNAFQPTDGEPDVIPIDPALTTADQADACLHALHHLHEGNSAP
ncbi:MAG: gluconokinase, GntK/IdnK-type [Pseudomonadota bacterium]